MKSFIANENDASRRLDKYILKVADIPKGQMYKFLRTGHIKVNKKKKDGSYILLAGDVITFFIDDSFFKDNSKKDALQKKSFTLDVVFENEDILIINKPAGLKSQPDKKSEDALSEFVKSYLLEKGEYNPENEATFAPAICNRLDVNTSGLIIAAKNAESLRIINEKIKNREIKKFYRCIVNGIPSKNSDTLTGYILKNREKNISEIIKTEKNGALFVKTGYKVLCSQNGKSLLEVELHTGRSHQIRAHLSSVGHPLSGDFKYGGGNGTQKLCAFRLLFDFNTDSGKLNYLKDKIIEIKEPFSL